MATRHYVRTNDVVSEPVVPHVVEETVIEPATVVETHRVIRRGWSRFSASQFVHGACGLFLVIVGAVTIGRAGFGESITAHTVDVLGLRTTALLGLVELFAGLLLLCAAIAPEGRGFGGFMGVVLLVGGIIVAAGSDQMLDDLHTEAGLGWLAIVVGVAAILGAVLPVFLVDRRSTRVDVW